MSASTVNTPFRSKQRHIFLKQRNTLKIWNKIYHDALCLSILGVSIKQFDSKTKMLIRIKIAELTQTNCIKVLC
jgi:hypothetical protein